MNTLFHVPKHTVDYGTFSLWCSRGAVPEKCSAEGVETPGFVIVGKNTSHNNGFIRDKSKR